MKIRNVFLLLFALILTGCESELYFFINLMDFDSKKKSVPVNGKMAMEITSCTDRKTGMPSDDVFKLQNQIPYVFKGAKYVECKKVRYKSYAIFEMLAYVDNVQDGKAVDDGVINFSFFKSKDNQSRFLNVFVPSKLRSSINKFIESNMYTDIGDISLNLSIDPGGKPLKFTIVGAYLDDAPVQLRTYNNNGGKFSVKIPTYGLKALLEQNDGIFSALFNAVYIK